MRSEQPSLVRSASYMGMATFLSRILGLVREQVFAFLFGASNAADAFNIAFRIPNLLRDLFAEGAMSSAFVPNFTRALVSSRRAAFDLLAAILSLLAIGLTIFALVGIVFSPQLVALYASAYQAVPGKFELAVTMTRIMFPFFPLVAMAAVTMGALNALGYFFIPAFAPAMFNVASILTGIILCPLFARFTSIPAVFGWATGVVVGGFFQFYLQWWKIKRQGFSFSDLKAVGLTHPKKLFCQPGVKQVLWLLVPGTIGLAATQLNILINSIYATSQGTGPVSWLNYAFRLMQFPIGIFGVSLAVATLPRVSKNFALNDSRGAGRELNHALRMTLAINGPAAIGLMVIGLPIIQLLFQHGQFHEADSIQTAAALFWYAAGLPGYSAVKVVVPVYYALNLTRVPVIFSFIAVGVNTVLNHLFLRVFHFPFWALALATAATSTLNALLLIMFLSTKLRSRIPGVVNFRFFSSLFIHGVVSILIGVIAVIETRVFYSFEVVIASYKGWHLIFLGGEIAIILATTVIFWLGVGKVFHIDEINEATELLSKLRKRIIK